MEGKHTHSLLAVDRGLDWRGGHSEIMFEAAEEKLSFLKGTKTKQDNVLDWQLTL